MLHTMEDQVAILAYAIHVPQRLHGYFISRDQREMNVGSQLPAHLACDGKQLVGTLNGGCHKQDIFIVLCRPFCLTNSM